MKRKPLGPVWACAGANFTYYNKHGLIGNMNPLDPTGQLFRHRRQALGLTQMELAQSAGVALPTLQTLEAGRSNPSIDTLRNLGRVLGLNLEVRPKNCDWDRLVELGLPLASDLKKKRRGIATPDTLLHEVRLALLEPAPTVRHEDALIGLLVALSEYYPTFFLKKLGRNKKVTRLLQRVQGRHIKLKRLALHTIASYL